MEHFAQVAQTALSHGVSVALFAGPGEEALTTRIEQACSNANSGFLLNLAGQLPLPARAAMETNDVFIQLDGGRRPVGPFYPPPCGRTSASPGR